MNYLGHPQAELETAGGLWTAREISQQPAVWPKIEALLNGGAGALRAYLRPLLDRRDLRIILTGAGTSAFIGECLAPALKRSTQLRVDAIENYIRGLVASAPEQKHRFFTQAARLDTLPRTGREHGRAAAVGGTEGTALRAAPFAHHDSPAARRRAGSRWDSAGLWEALRAMK